MLVCVFCVCCEELCVSTCILWSCDVDLIWEDVPSLKDLDFSDFCLTFSTVLPSGRTFYIIRVNILAHQNVLQTSHCCPHLHLEHSNIFTGTNRLQLLCLRLAASSRSIATVNMASIVPFSRSQWASQSLRVTAKEMSIVSARGKNSTIAERFSK